MSEPWSGTRSPARSMAGEKTSANLADLLERILDKGIVIVGDIQINLLDIELLTIKLRLLVASVDRAKEMGIDWWEHDPSLSSKARQAQTDAGDDDRALQEENRRLRERLAALEAGEPAAVESAESGGEPARKTAGRTAGKSSGTSGGTPAARSGRGKETRS